MLCLLISTLSVYKPNLGVEESMSVQSCHHNHDSLDFYLDFNSYFMIIWYRQYILSKLINCTYDIF